jgi:hypothetical protein
MEMWIDISLKVNIAESGANINEICNEVRETVASKVVVRVTEEIIEGMQEHIRSNLTSSSGRVAKKGFGKHEQKGSEGMRCRFRVFKREGFRKSLRRIKTDLGEVAIRVGYISCCGCGKKYAPILDVLNIGAYAGHSTGLERVVSEVISSTSYARGEDEIEARGSAPVPRSSAHRWVADRVIPDSEPKECVSGMADGTGFKKWPAKRGDLRVVIGLDTTGKPYPLGTYAGQDWKEIGEDIRKKLKTGKRDEVQMKLFAMDGEPAIDFHLADVAERAQRCVWHLPRELKYAMWEDKVSLSERRSESSKMAKLVGVEIPKEDWENIKPEDKEAICEKVTESERKVMDMAEEFRKKGYSNAATYIENASGKIFEHVYLWLETGIISPRTTSILEGIMKELGRRVKKLGWNWSDLGIVRIAKMVLLRRYDNAKWENYWNKTLGLQGRCKITITNISRVTA